ncbi:MAG: response regulator [Synergistaceae bacterium]|jgi:signal transduction histidine kinase/CheY-like chemotaxis protein/HPt (histidine-containing phosphotransfer) domain-containing protein|nr:response regulator [Synergistaceae bacterium]
MAAINIKTIIRANRAQLAFVFLAFSMMAAASSLFVSGIVEKQILSSAKRALATAEALISSNFNEIEIITMNASFSILDRLEDGETQEDIRDYITEYSVWLSKYAGGKFGVLWLLGYIRGELFSGAGWNPSGEFKPLERPWYVEAIKGDDDSVVFTKPYHDRMTGKLIVSAAKVLRGSRGENYGVLAMDIDMTAISNYVRGLQFNDGGYGFLLDSNRVVIAPHDVPQPIWQLGEFIQSSENDMSGGVYPMTMKDASGDTLVVVCVKMENGWYIGIATPTDSYYRDVYLMMLILSVLGAIFMLVLSGFLIRLSIAKMRSDEENKSKSSFLARMSHEIRTPMNSILGMSELIKRQHISKQVHEYISIISQSGETLLAIINDILDFSKIESGQMRIDPRKYHVSSLINDLINVVQMRAADKRIDFFVNVDCNIPSELVGDDVRVRQVALNLLTNAVKYTKEGFMSLEVSLGAVSEHDLELVFNVRDSGVGIKKEDMDRLFVDFSRLGPAYTERIEGTGLGLVISRSYCKLMGGDISVTSEYGVGSTFSATMIQKFEDDKKIASVEDPERKRVLFYEARSSHYKSIVSAMSCLGLHPVYSRSLTEFMNELREGEYDYAFISSEHYADCVDTIKKRNLPVHLVIMVDLGEVSTFRDVDSITMPLYSVSIANVLNGVVANGLNRRDSSGQFSAPSARALIVDDFSINLRVAKELVAQADMEVDTCLGGDEAIELVKNNFYDIVFMDHMMPGMDGIETTAAIRKMGERDEYYSRLPIVALTANAIAGQREMFLRSGMDDFLAKPIEMQKLVGILKKWIPEEKRVDVNLTESDGVPDGAAEIEADGLDVAAGLKNVGADVAVYKDILLDYCRDANDTAVQMKRSETEGDADRYVILVHSLKGASLSVGALGLGQSAALLEESVKTGGLKALRDRTDALWEELRRLTGAIYAALAWESRELVTGKARAGVLLENSQLELLKDALLNMDVKKINEMLSKYLAMPLDSRTKNLVSNIEQDVLMFEYEKAVEKINLLNS